MPCRGCIHMGFRGFVFGTSHTMASPQVKRTAKAKDQQHPPPQLSCKLCREKKLKCDKQAPCGNCKSSGAECNTVFRHRLPRGRHARPSDDTLPFQSTTRPTSSSQDFTSKQSTHNQERNRRVRRLESLVAEQAPDVLSELDVGKAITAIVLDVWTDFVTAVPSDGGAQVRRYELILMFFRSPTGQCQEACRVQRSCKYNLV
jgi:hypothetical protein